MTPAPEKDPAAVETAELEIAVQRQREGSADPSKREPTTAAGAVEKAAPIPAEEVERYIAKCNEMSEGGRYSWWSRLAEILADRASQKKRIREDERDRLYAQAREDRDAAWASPDAWAATDWLDRQGAMLPADRARLRGDAS